MKDLQLLIDIRKSGLKGSLLELCKKWGEQKHLNKRLKDVFKTPMRADYDIIVDQLADEHWNKFTDDVSRKREERTINNKILKHNKDDKGISITLEEVQMIKKNYPYICAHIQCARNLGIFTDIPYAECYEVIRIPISGRIRNLKRTKAK